MTKAKYLIMLLVIAAFMLLLPNVSNAAVDYTRTIPSNEGTIKLNFTGLELDIAKQYEFALVRQGGTPENWFSIDDGYTTSEASVTLSSATSKIIEVLKATDTGFIYIREKDNLESYILENYKVNLKLPYLQSLAYSADSWEYNLYTKLYGSIGDVFTYSTNLNTYFVWKKVTDIDLIKTFLNIKNNNQDISKLEVSLPPHPETGYSSGIETSFKNKNNGLYLLWVKRTGENCKEVFSCIVHDGLEEATKVEEYLEGLDVESPIVKKIYVSSPESGTYKTGQTVKIRVDFSEQITGETLPTLKVKFGESSVREITNGTIQNQQKNGEAPRIEYSYDIQDSDKGQLATVDLTGGNIKDSSGNAAILSCPVLTGNTIKANVEGTNTNNTENQDKETNQTKLTLSSISITTAPTKISYTEGENFDKTGMVVTAKYSDGTTKEIINYTVSSTAALKTTDNKVVITYIENGVTKTVEQAISVSAKSNPITLSSISITTAPTKVSYTEGEVFNKSGMVITAKYSDGTTKQVTNYTVSSTAALKTTDKKVVITYVENGITKTAEQTISVKAKTINNNTSNSNKDNTTSSGKLPQTGAEIWVTLLIVCIAFGCVFAYTKYNKFRDI